MKNKQSLPLRGNQKITICFVLIINFYLLFIIYNYWKSDVYFNSSQFEKALAITPTEPNFISKLALSDGNIETAFKALKLNPYNQNTRRILISNLVNSNNLEQAEYIILDGIDKSPNDPKLYYQLGILQLKLGTEKEAIESLEKAVELKPNYKEGRFALGVTYIDVKEYQKAKENLEYILKSIDPNDELTKKYLDQVNSASK